MCSKFIIQNYFETTKYSWPCDFMFFRKLSKSFKIVLMFSHYETLSTRVLMHLLSGKKQQNLTQAMA